MLGYTSRRARKEQREEGGGWVSSKDSQLIELALSRARWWVCGEFAVCIPIASHFLPRRYPVGVRTRALPIIPRNSTPLFLSIPPPSFPSLSIPLERESTLSSFCPIQTHTRPFLSLSLSLSLSTGLYYTRDTLTREVDDACALTLPP